MLSARSPAKLNLRLKIEHRKPDGFHELSMLNLLVNFCDEITIQKSLKSEFELSGVLDSKLAQELSDPKINLVLKAVNLFQELFEIEESVKISLHKNIPAGAGLAGGSGNAATTLKLLLKLFSKQLPKNADQTILKYSTTLGTDLPFYFSSGFAKVFGIGETVQVLENSKKIKLLLFLSRSAVNTVSAYKIFRSRFSNSDLQQDSKLRSINNLSIENNLRLLNPE